MPKFKYIAMTLGAMLMLGAGCSNTPVTNDPAVQVTTNSDALILNGNNSDFVTSNSNTTNETAGNNNENTNETVADTTVADTDATTNTTTETTENDIASTQIFDITAKQFSFDPATITVRKGDIVILNITSSDVPHGFSLPDFDVNETLTPGKTKTVQFVADKAGTFNYSCNVTCGSGHSTMSGQLVVE